jgi:hypothetical protein
MVAHRSQRAIIKENGMKFISTLSSLAAALVLFAPTRAVWTADLAKTKPNVLFIAVDDLNDWVGCLEGHPQAHTPHIDKLAREGTAFVHAYSNASVCGPSRTALMYGISPHKSSSYGHYASYSPQLRLPEERLPLNLVFQKNGYYKAGCGKIFHDISEYMPLIEQSVIFYDEHYRMREKSRTGKELTEDGKLHILPYGYRLGVERTHR